MSKTKENIKKIEKNQLKKCKKKTSQEEAKNKPTPLNFDAASTFYLTSLIQFLTHSLVKGKCQNVKTENT